MSTHPHSERSVVVMPRLSDVMEEATIVRWLKGDGDDVVEGEELVEIETDKATVTYEADRAGTLSIIAGEGATVALGAPICSLANADADAPEQTPTPTPTPLQTPSTRSASPVARRMAAAAGIEIDALTGTGPAGRVVKGDVERAVEARGHDRSAPSPSAAVPTPGPAAAVDPRGTPEVERLTRVQQVVADRTSAAKATQPEFVLETEVDMQAVTDLRAALRDLDGVVRAPSINDFVIRAVAVALQRHPNANATYRDGTIQRFSRINVGIAVAAPGSLLVATIEDADRLGLADTSERAGDLVSRAREGALAPSELTGSTFTVSNLGMYGVTRMVPILNAGQAGILGVGAIVPRAWDVDGRLAVGPAMSLTLVSDHRVLYGADAAELLAAIRGGLEAPLGLML